MIKPGSTGLERLRYRQGRMLQSRDFCDQAAVEAQLRWWHNRALHNAFGVSFGLKVSSVVNKERLLTEISVTCGSAYDCFGRELILQNTREIPLPDAPQDGSSVTLLIRYKETNSFPKGDEMSGVCVETKLSQFCEQPEFIWKPSEQVTLDDGVPLAVMKYQSGTFSFDEEFTTPISRPLARPRIASGATIPGGTAWEDWNVKGQGNNLIQIGFQVRVDTSAAGFTEVPCYFAWLQEGNSGQAHKGFFLTHFEHIDEPTINGFVFRLWTPTLVAAEGKKTDEDFKGKFLLFARKQGLFVWWLGIQPHGTPAAECNQKK